VLIFIGVLIAIVLRWIADNEFDERMLRCPPPLPRDRWRTDAPVLVTIGEMSEAYFGDGARDLAELLPHVRIETLLGQDHAALWMAPESVAASARRFLAAT
jgi:pimeloyl-ACP methyl ester carboxylesterase